MKRTSMERQNISSSLYLSRNEWSYDERKTSLWSLSSPWKTSTGQREKEGKKESE